MTDHVEHPDYPLNITADEGRLGFEIRSVGALDEYYPDRWTPVVCKVLSSSDIVVKTKGFGDGVMYSHLQMGFLCTTALPAQVRNPNSDS